MEFVEGLWTYVLPFLILLSVVVFVHEFGHFLLARYNGVRVEVFSIGFGREVFGFTAKSGTRWKVSLVPLGGYVKMFGDADAASTPDTELQLTEEEKKVAFPYKRLGQRAAIVAAGPIANFVLAILIFAAVFMIAGQPTTEALVSEVMEDSAAGDAGILPGDMILSIDGKKIKRFADIQRLVHLSNGAPMAIVVDRSGVLVNLTATPRMMEREDGFGKRMTPILGIKAIRGTMVQLGPIDALGAAVSETYHVTTGTLIAVGQMINQSRSADELGGPLRIAQFAGEAAQMGFVNYIMLLAILSVNLGLINLFPIPLLDGGHLLFYGIEAVIRRPLTEKTQEIGFRVGLILVFGLMIFATWNDLVHLKVWDFFINLAS